MEYLPIGEWCKSKGLLQGLLTRQAQEARRERATRSVRLRKRSACLPVEEPPGDDVPRRWRQDRREELVI